MMRVLLFLSLLFMSARIGCVAQPVAFDVEGHRGCRGLMPENTLPAFLKALDLGVQTLEMDVVISQDKQVVVSHDPYMNAAFCLMPDGSPIEKSQQRQLLLYQMPYAEIKRFDSGSIGNAAFPEQQKRNTYKPLLSEVIAQTEAYRKANKLPPVSYNIEIKSQPSEYDKSQPQPADFCDLVVGVLKKAFPETSTLEKRVILQSFDFAVLKHWHQQAAAGKYPNVRLSALVSNMGGVAKNLNELGFKPAIYSPEYRLLNPDSIADLHRQGIRVVPWTINQRSDMERLKAWGVDGLITDYPDRAKGL